MAEPDVPAPIPPPPPADLAVLQAPQQPGQQVVYLNWSHFKPEFTGNLMRMQKHICFAPMTG